MDFLSQKHNIKISKKKIISYSIAFVTALLLCVFTFVKADFTSTSFQLENPINIIEGGQASSSSFQYYSNTSQLTGGQSTSLSFGQNAGFLYFPSASTPVVSATPGSSQVTLSWTAASGVFANISSYSVGVSTSSSGPFTYTSVGNVLSNITSGLTNGTLYYFKILSYAAGVVVSESVVVSATPVAVVSPGGGGGGGGGGGSQTPTSDTKIIFFGKAYPNSSVTLLKDAVIVASTISGSDANFNIVLNNPNAGSYVFSIYSTDKNGIRSALQSFPVTVTTGVTINVGGIFLAPTLSGDKSQVKQGDDITFFGQSTPDSEVTIVVHSATEIFKKVQSDRYGVYLHTMDTLPLEIGSHNARSKVALVNEISSYSNSYNFTVGKDNVEAPKNTCGGKGDLNSDCRVNLVDFSIAAFWYKKPSLNIQTTQLEKEKLNGDGRINLVDFSIMAYYWTG